VKGELCCLQSLRKLALAVLFLLLPALAAAAGTPVAVFPLQELGEGRNDANLPFTKLLVERLTDRGSEVIDLETVIDFMANNRIRTLGHLETLNISRVRDELGAGFLLLGTVSQLKERPEKSMGLTLNLIRTSDVRSIWTYIGSMSTGEERRMLGIGEPQTTADLQRLLLDEIIEQWPWQIIKEEPLAAALYIDSAVLEPKYVSPGDEIHCRVRLRKTWPAGEAPRVFFKADEQLYPATVSADGSTFEATWVAGEESGTFSVILLVEWPRYGRTETTILGNYVIDATPPLFELELPSAKIFGSLPVFNQQLEIKPRMLVRKPLSHWRLSIYSEGGDPIGDMEEAGNLPENIIWKGRYNMGDGIYEVVVEAWDMAGNMGRASRKVEMNRSLPVVSLGLDRGDDEEFVVNMEHDGRVPLKYWRLEMWTKEGRMITKAEGQELPGEIGIELSDSEKDQEIQGFLFYEDILGKKVRRKVEDLLPSLKKKDDTKEEDTGISEKWVEEF